MYVSGEIKTPLPPICIHVKVYITSRSFQQEVSLSNEIQEDKAISHHALVYIGHIQPVNLIKRFYLTIEVEICQEVGISPLLAAERTCIVPF